MRKIWRPYSHNT